MKTNTSLTKNELLPDRRLSGSHAIMESLLKQGVKCTFGYPGGTVIPLFDAFLDYDDKIRNILVRHEQAAAHAADGFARASGKPGVCIATSGPGATNLVTGIMTAYMDSSPVIAIAGQVPTHLIGNDAFQESDMMGITMPIVKHSFQLRRADDIDSTFHKAFKIAGEGRPGPVYVEVPKDVQTASTHKPNRSTRLQGFHTQMRGDPRSIACAAKMILAAERPLIIAGGGVVLGNAHNELAQLVQATAIPVATTMMGKGAFDERHPMCLGMLGMHGRKAANYAAVNCDLIIAIGCRFSDRVTGNVKTFAEHKKIIHIDIDPAEIGKNIKSHVQIVGDAKPVLTELRSAFNAGLRNLQHSGWSDRMKLLNSTCWCNLDITAAPLSQKRVMLELRKLMEQNDDCIVCTGVGQHQMFAAHYLKFRRPRKFITSGGAGTMGFGLPAAMGAKMAVPEAHVFDIDGDGSFQMNIQELATLKEEGIKVIPIIMNNNYLGMVRQWLEIFMDKRYSQVCIGKVPDFVKVAEAYGLSGISVERPSELAEALSIAMKNDETMILDISVQPEENILPMLSPGGNIRDAFGGCMIDKGIFFRENGR